jgi:hypothetical protein
MRTKIETQNLLTVIFLANLNRLFFPVALVLVVAFVTPLTLCLSSGDELLDELFGLVEPSVSGGNSFSDNNLTFVTAVIVKFAYVISEARRKGWPSVETDRSANAALTQD